MGPFSLSPKSLTRNIESTVVSQLWQEVGEIVCGKGTYRYGIGIIATAMQPKRVKLQSRPRFVYTDK
jgi:hypothetical protein